jgi:predicted transcriptional regulator
MLSGTFYLVVAYESSAMDFSHEDLFEAIDRLVNGLLERAGVVKPPVNALEIAENHLGIPVEIVELSEEDERGRPRPRSRPSGSGIYLSPDMTEETQQRTAADGIARALLPDILRKLDVAPGTEDKQFSSQVRGLVIARLLVPNKILRAALKECRYDLLALKKLFTTATMETIALRLLDLDEACAISIVDDGIVTMRRANRFAAVKKLEPAEQACLDQVMKLDLPCRVRKGEWTVQGWPVPDRTIRRIILRAVPDDV